MRFLHVRRAVGSITWAHGLHIVLSRSWTVRLLVLVVFSVFDLLSGGQKHGDIGTDSFFQTVGMGCSTLCDAGSPMWNSSGCISVCVRILLRDAPEQTAREHVLTGTDGWIRSKYFAGYRAADESRSRK